MTNSRAPVALIVLPFALLLFPLHAQSEILKLEATASWYGQEFNGRKTSSGEIFDMYALTAAHKTLPFGTLLEVTNLANGKRVTVRVNDRGPFVPNRELDVSFAAAEALGMTDSGTAKVSIRKLGIADAAPATQTAGVPQPVTVTQTQDMAQPPSPAPGTTLWRIQLGSFSSEDNATRFAVTLRKSGFDPSLERTGSVIRVVLAGVQDSQLETTKARLVSGGYGDMLVRREIH